MSPQLFEVEDEAPTGLLRWAGAQVTSDGKITPRDRPSKNKVIAASSFLRTRAEVEARMTNGDWKNIGARHIVALYAVLHERVYGIAPLELTPSATYFAVVTAANLAKKHFDGDYTRMVDFLSWAWEREEEREDWRRKNDKETRRIGWRLMFTASFLLTDYLTAKRAAKVG